MSCLSKTIDIRPARRTAARRPVAVLGSVATIRGSTSVIIEDLCPEGARLVGHRLPPAGEEILLRANDSIVLGRIAWAKDDARGVAFEEGEMPVCTPPIARRPATLSN